MGLSLTRQPHSPKRYPETMYRSIDSKFWDDRDIKNLKDPFKKLFFLYLITNKHSHSAGIYPIPMAYIAHDLDESVETVQNGLKCLLPKFIEYDFQTEEVFVKNMLFYQPKNGAVIASTKAQLRLIQSPSLVGRFTEYYQLKLPELYPTLTQGTPTVDPPFVTQMEATTPKSDPPFGTSAKKRKRERERDRDRENNDAHSFSNSSIPLGWDHPTMKIYERIMNSRILAAHCVEIIKAVVGESPENLARWEQVLKVWISRGYRPQNIEGILEWYKTGIPAPTRHGNEQGNDNTLPPRLTPQEQAEAQSYADWRKKLREEKGGGSNGNHITP